jgi:biopolymer transport protein ExbB
MADPTTEEAPASAATVPTTEVPDAATTLPPPDAHDPAMGALDRAMELIQAGGPVVMLLICFSVIALAIIFVKRWQFGRVNIGDTKTARHAARLYLNGHTAQALSLAVQTRNPAAHLLMLAINGQRRGLPEAAIREEAFRYGGDLLEMLRGGLRPLEVISSLAPLLGLFGTVLGMIDAFRQLEAAGNQVNPAILSGGIWEALLTTAVGLAVAIPVIIVLNWLERSVETLAHEMDSVVTMIFTVDLLPSVSDETEHDRTAYRAAAAAAPGE